MSSKVTKAMPELEALHSDLQTEGLQLMAEPLESDEALPENVTDEAVGNVPEETLQERSGS
jgi:hypothetical protein